MTQVPFDFRKVYDRTLYELMCEVFAEQGIVRITEDELEDLVVSVTKGHYHSIIGEFRHEFGLDRATEDMRFGSVTPRLKAGA